MNVLIYLNVNHSVKGGLFRSVFERTKRLINSDVVDNYEVISVTDDYRGLLKKVNTSKGYINFIEDDVNEFTQYGVRCEYVKVGTSYIDRYLDKKSIKYNINRRLKICEKNNKFNNIDLISVHTAYPDGVIVNKIKEKYGIPYILTLHGSDINIEMKEGKNTRNVILKTLNEAEKCIFVSQELLDTAKKLGYRGDNAVVIPNGYDEDKFKEVDKNIAKSELGLSGKVIGFAGNLQHVKRADKLVEIFDEISKRDKEITFAVIGDGPEKENLITGCNEKGLNLKYFGRVDLDEVPKYMNAFDLLILPSRNEGWPCVIFEAMACGSKIVGANNGGIKEAIGSFGSIVDEGEKFEERFAKTVVEELNKQYDLEKRNEYIKGYSWESISVNELELYKDINNKLYV